MERDYKLEASRHPVDATHGEALAALGQALTDALLEADRAVADICQRFQAVSTLISQQAVDHAARQQIQSELGRVIVGMQFHDALAQRVQHVVGTLKQLEQAGSFVLPPAVESHPRWDVWQGTSLAPTTRGEQLAAAVVEDEEAGNDVELF